MKIGTVAAAEAQVEVHAIMVLVVVEAVMGAHEGALSFLDADLLVTEMVFVVALLV